MKAENKIYTASAPCRICLAGEDIDWILGPSILCTVGLRLDVQISIDNIIGQNISILATGSLQKSLFIPISEVGKYSGHSFDYICATIKSIQDMGVNIVPMRIVVYSEIPPSAGLASSAAITVATAKALCSFYNLDDSKSNIAKLACKIELNELRTGAGQMDQYACALGGINYINCNCIPPTEIESFRSSESMKFIIIDTMQAHCTKDIIQVKKQRLANNDSDILDYIATTEQLIICLRKELQSKSLNLQAIGQIITECHNSLRDHMKVSTPLIEKCISNCILNGAYGAKITGTGMGGCIFALATDESIINIANSVKDLPVRTYVVPLDTTGVY